MKLVAHAERRANLKANDLCKLRAGSLADEDTLASRVWRWRSVRCGIRWSLASLHRVEQRDIFLSVSLLRLTTRILYRNLHFL